MYGLDLCITPSVSISGIYYISYRKDIWNQIYQPSIQLNRKTFDKIVWKCSKNTLKIQNCQTNQNDHQKHT